MCVYIRATISDIVAAELGTPTNEKYNVEYFVQCKRKKPRIEEVSVGKNNNYTLIHIIHMYLS